MIKKVFLLIVIVSVVVVFSLAGCKSEIDEEATQPSVEETPEVTSTTASNVQGRLLWNGEPVEEVKVKLATYHGGESFITTTDENGEYSFSVPAGEYNLFYQHPDGTETNIGSAFPFKPMPFNLPFVVSEEQILYIDEFNALKKDDLEFIIPTSELSTQPTLEWEPYPLAENYLVFIYESLQGKQEWGYSIPIDETFGNITSFSPSFHLLPYDNYYLNIVAYSSEGYELADGSMFFRVKGNPQKISGICYGPFRDGQDPNSGIFPTEEELREDITLISKLSNSVRTYGITESLNMIPQICQDVGVDCYPGAWISKDVAANEKEIQSLIQVANKNLSHVKGLVIGNEVLAEGDLAEEELIGYIMEVKEKTNIPVGTAESWSIWQEHPMLAEAVDFISVNIHPYWEGISSKDRSIDDYLFTAWDVFSILGKLEKSYPEKRIIIGEAGWPTEGEKNGEAVPSEEYQKEFLLQFLLLNQSYEVEYFFFEAFDEKWKEKSEGSVGAHWGLYYSNGSLKPLLSDLVPSEVYGGINR